jgi:hypothetical protein
MRGDSLMSGCGRIAEGGLGMMLNRVELFAKEDTHNHFERLINRVKETIKNMSNDSILGADIEEWTTYYFDENEVEPITLFLDKKDMVYDERKIRESNSFRRTEYESEYFEYDGIGVTVMIPFGGTNSLLYVTPSQRIMQRFYIEKVEPAKSDTYGKLIFCMGFKIKDIEGKDNNYINLRFNSYIEDYLKMIDFINHDAKNYNFQLQNVIRNSLVTRKTKAETFIAVGKMLDISMKINPNAPSVTPIILKKNVVKKSIMPTIKKSEDEYQISEEIFDNIKRIVNIAGSSMEKSAKTFSKLEEEELRDVIIAFLNIYYQGSATAETFSRTGKTDIHIFFNNKSAYIAECKIWHGDKKLQEALLQLFSYTTWRDVKTSLVVFNKEHKSFTSLVDTIKTSLEKSSLFQRFITCGHNEWICEFRKSADSNDKRIVHVVVFDLYIEKTTKLKGE